MLTIEELLLPAGHHNRPGDYIHPEKIIIHRTGNPGSSAKANRDFFATTPEFASAHYCVDSQQIIRCIPEQERAHHCRGANFDGIGIETCEPLTKLTYQNVLDLIVDILLRYHWQPTTAYLQPHSKYDPVNRHYDPFNWDDYQAARCNPVQDLFNPFTFYADVKNQFLQQGGKLE
jgi:N-acetylmuramoyl-L-alanine amidase